MSKKLSISITYSPNEKRWIVCKGGSSNLYYECKSREAALVLVADLFEMNL